MQARFIGYQRRDIGDIAEFAGCVQEALLLNTKRAYVEVNMLKHVFGANSLINSMFPKALLRTILNTTGGVAQ